MNPSTRAAEAILRFLSTSNKGLDEAEKQIAAIIESAYAAEPTHHENCDVNDQNIEGIKKPCNCGAVTDDAKELAKRIVEDLMNCWPSSLACQEVKLQSRILPILIPLISEKERLAARLVEAGRLLNRVKYCGYMKSPLFDDVFKFLTNPPTA